MPKDPSKNINHYKICGGQMNPYEFQQNQDDLTQPVSEAEGNWTADPIEAQPATEQPHTDHTVTKQGKPKRTKSAPTRKVAAQKDTRNKTAAKASQKPAAKARAK